MGFLSVHPPEPEARGVPPWVSELAEKGLRRWREGRWVPADPSDFPHEHRVLLEHLLLQIRNPFILEPGRRLWFGRDDLARTSLRPRHAGLDIGSRICSVETHHIGTLPAGTPFQSVVPGGYVVGGINLQKVAYVYRDGRNRFKLIVEFGYHHAQFAGKARGRIRCFSSADKSDFLKWPCAASQAIQRDGRIVGYETLGWVKNPGGFLGHIEPGRYQTQDPILAVRHIPKGEHLHLNVAGIFDDAPDLRTRFLNEEVKGRLEGLKSP